MSEVKGRPTKYKAEYVKTAKKLCELGATDCDVAEALGVHVATINRWKAEHKEFCESLKVGKAEADNRVEMSLYRKAVGYEYEAVKIFQFQGKKLVVPYTEIQHPDTTAAIFWLKNRMTDKYREKPESDEAQQDQAISKIQIEVIGASKAKSDTAAS